MANDEFEKRWRDGIDKQFSDQNVTLAGILKRLEETNNNISVIRTSAVTTAKFEEFKDGIRAQLEAEREARRTLAKDMEQLKTAIAVLRWVFGIVFTVGIAVLKFWPK